jgi:hypothetical protein
MRGRIISRQIVIAMLVLFVFVVPILLYISLGFFETESFLNEYLKLISSTLVNVFVISIGAVLIIALYSKYKIYYHIIDLIRVFDEAIESNNKLLKNNKKIIDIFIRDKATKHSNIDTYIMNILLLLLDSKDSILDLSKIDLEYLISCSKNPDTTDYSKLRNILQEHREYLKGVKDVYCKNLPLLLLIKRIQRIHG